MSGGTGTVTGARAGHTRITHAALRKTLEAVTAQAFHVSPGAVGAELEDDRGLLGVKVTVKLAAPPLRALQGGPTVFEQAQRARTAIAVRGFALTGMRLGRVDIRLTAAKRAPRPEGRVQ
ncbi:hypothetical protein ACIPY3_14380 [Paenarthrobacter sp. NPDC089714]|uniref:hypothetical protein n=1 Tax=unclassified Paenarthrobacter TaxID=2634190 RepID=UPI0038121087